MQDIVIKITADTSGIQSTIDMLRKMNVVSDEVFDAYTKSVKESGDAIKKNTEDATKSFDKLHTSLKEATSNNEFAKNLDASAGIVKTANSLQSLRAQFAAAREEARQNLVVYGEFDKRTIAAAKSAQELAKKIEDTGRVIKALDPETKFNTIKNFAAAIGGTFQVATGALQAFGVENEKAKKLAEEFQGALNIFAGLQQITELKDTFRDLAISLGFSKKATVENIAVKQADIAVTEGQTVALEGQKVAQEATTVVTEAGSVANEEFAATLSATGVGAIVVVLGTLIAAMVAYSNSANEADKATKLFNDSRDKGIDKVSEEKTKLGILLEEYNKANISQAEKKRISQEMIQIEPQLTSAFDKQGNALKNLKPTIDDIVNAKLKQAEADALIGEIGKINAENDKLRAKGVKEEISAWDYISSAIKNVVKGGALFGGVLAGNKISTDAVANAQDRLNEKVENNNKIVGSLTDKLKELQKQGVSLTDPAKDTSGKTGKEKTPFEEAIDRVKEGYEKLRAEESKAYGKLYQDPLLFSERITNLNKKQTEDLIKVYQKFNKDASTLINDLNKPADTTNEIKPIEKKINIQAEFPTDKDQEAFDMTINPNLVPKRTGPVTIPVHVETPEELEVDKKVDQLKKQLGDQIVSSAEEISNRWIAVWQDAQLQVDKNRITSLDKESKDLDLQYNRKLIGRVEYDAKIASLDQKKREAERKLKHDQDIADRNKALFNVAINTAASIAKSFAEFGPAATPTVPYLLGIGAAQAAAILASPLPKYKKGTLSVPGIGSEDTQLAMLTPGEAVIPKDTNQRYKDSIAAIYHGKISPSELNSFVKMKLKGDYSANSGQLTAKMDTSDLYALGKMMKKNDGVYVKNLGEFAAILADMNNPRR